LLNWY